MKKKGGSSAAHGHLLRAARREGEGLHEAIMRGGEMALPLRPRGSLARVLARAMVGQQVSSQVARRFWERIEAGSAESGERLPDFFHAEHTDLLRSYGLSRMKVSFLLGLREASASGLLAAARIKKMSHEERVAHLTQMRGVGRWTCDMIGIFYCLDEDVWPEGDLAVRRSFERLGGRDISAVSFAPYRSYLALHMWREKNARAA